MNFFDTAFWQNFFSNLLATIIGVALGIPVALFLNRRVQAYTEKEKTAKIFDSLVGELEHNHASLSEWWHFGKDNWKLTTIGVKMSDEVWNAFSDGGELEWIKEPLVLSRLANAYADVKRIKYLSDKYINFNSMDTSTAKYILADLTSLIETAQIRIQETVAVVKMYRSSGEPWKEYRASWKV